MSYDDELNDRYNMWMKKYLERAKTAIPSITLEDIVKAEFLRFLIEDSCSWAESEQFYTKLRQHFNIELFKHA